MICQNIYILTYANFFSRVYPRDLKLFSLINDVSTKIHFQVVRLFSLLVHVVSILCFFGAFPILLVVPFTYGRKNSLGTSLILVSHFWYIWV